MHAAMHATEMLLQLRNLRFFLFIANISIAVFMHALTL